MNKRYSSPYLLTVSILSVLVGILVLIGWTFNIPILESVRPGWVAMKANTAFNFIFLGLAGVGLSQRQRRWQTASKVLGLCVFTLGFMTLLEHCFGFNLGIDCAIFADTEFSAGGAPGRMALFSSINFIFLGLAVWAIHYRSGISLSQFLSALSALLTFFPIFGNAFGTTHLKYGINSFVQMALHTAVLFALLSLGLFFHRYKRGIVGQALRSFMGGLLIRRQIPATALVLLGLGFFRYQGEAAGYFTSEFGVSLMIFCSITLLGANVFWNARILDRLDTERQVVSNQLKRLNEELDSKVKIRTQELEDLRGEAEKQGALLQIVLDQMPTAVIVAEAPSGKIVLANKQVNQVWRHQLIPSNSIEEYNEWIGFHKDGRRYEGKDWPLARSLSTGAVISNEETLVKRGDGSRGVMLLSAAPIRDKSGSIVAGVVTCEDITERKRVEAELKLALLRMEAVLVNAPIALFALDRDYLFTYCDGKSLRLRGFRPEDFIGKSAFERYQNTPWLLEGITRARAGEASSQEGVFGESYFETHLSPLRQDDGEVMGVIGLSIDLSERKKAEEERALAKAQEQSALELARLRSQFLANISHEIRTPINGILGLTDLLLDTVLDPTQKDFADTIKNSGDSLLAIVNDLLDLSKVDSGKMELELLNFDLKHFTKSVYKTLLQVAESKNIKFIHEHQIDDDRRFFKGDAGRLRQILLNLLSNALKFTEQGSVTLRVTHSTGPNQSSWIKFEVIDSGIGLSQESIERLFQPFTQADASTTRRFGGTGLGLSISKRLVELMGGRIGVESEKGRGSNFWFEVSLSPGIGLAPRLPDTAEPLGFASAAKPFRILVAEDNFTNQKVALGMLKKLGCQANTVGDGHEALEALKSIPYDLVLMDCHMPNLDGYEATRLIRQSTLVLDPSIPIIAMTANAGDDQRDLCLKAGMDDFITKPVALKKLYEVMNKWLLANPKKQSRAA